jgi:hypothetical protein
MERYAGKTNNLKLVSSGEVLLSLFNSQGGLKEMKEELSNGKQMFAFLKMFLEGGKEVPKYVYISWNPAG